MHVPRGRPCARHGDGEARQELVAAEVDVVPLAGLERVAHGGVEGRDALIELLRQVLPQGLFGRVGQRVPARAQLRVGVITLLAEDALEADQPPAKGQEATTQGDERRKEPAQHVEPPLTIAQPPSPEAFHFSLLAGASVLGR